ncbi:MAG: formylglycine-generating enzyme family protein [Myxococcota bacterium]|nr:formylglycine-generating enzyme family protein [Myxococcota bacterium]
MNRGRVHRVLSVGNTSSWWMVQMLAQYREALHTWQQQMARERRAWSRERANYIDLISRGRIEEFWGLIIGERSLFSSLFIESKGFLHLCDDVQMSARVLQRFGSGLSLARQSDDFVQGLFDAGAFDRLLSTGFAKSEYAHLREDERQMLIEMSLRRVDIPMGAAISKAFQMGRYLCTQSLYASVMGENPSHFRGATRPVERVSWCDAILFCNKLSVREGREPCYAFSEPFENDDDWSTAVMWNREANGYRLPTATEWEYSAKAHRDLPYAGSNVADEVGWYGDDRFDEKQKGNSAQKTHPVAQKKANAFGLYDMSGNVDEWCFDNFNRGYGSEESDSTYSPWRLKRGGNWRLSSWFSRISDSRWNDASYRGNVQGFRIVCSG